MAELDLEWWRRGVVYEVYLRSFQDGDGDGIGDLTGVIQRLDYLAWLGIEALWLSPFYPSPQADFGYDITDFCGVDPLFGTVRDVDILIAEAHERGLAVVIDFVPNHTSDRHPWFVESRSSRQSPQRDWFVWTDARSDGGPPNNWLSLFGGSAWQWDEPTGQYYLHSFLPEQPDLDWRNSAVKAAMMDAIQFWLDRDVDGLRIDCAHFLMKDPNYRDNPPNPAFHPGEAASFHKNMGEYESQLHLHDLGHADIHPLYREIRQRFDRYGSARPRAIIGETHIWDPTEWATYYGVALDEMHLPFNFGLLKTPWDASSVRAHIDAIEAAMPAGGWPTFVLGNHDESRIASRIGADQARVAMMLLLTLRGTPTIYYGDELGMEDVPIPPQRQRDPWGLRMPGLNLGRDPQRTPMQWDRSPGAGFTEPNVEPWLPLAPDASERNVEAQVGEPASMLNLARSLIYVRRGKMALTNGDYQPIDGVPEGCFAFVRGSPAGRVLVALNFTCEPIALSLPELGRGTILVATGLDRAGGIDLAEAILQGNEGLVIGLPP